MLSTMYVEALQLCVPRDGKSNSQCIYSDDITQK